MRCNYLKLINRYYDNELSQDKKEFMDKHALSCPLCRQELAQFKALKQGISQDKVSSHSELFWQRLKGQIAKEETEEYKAEEFAFDFARWTRRLIPVPILASILIVIVSLNLNRANLIDEYLFTNQDNSVLELIENPGNQSASGWLLY